MTQDRKRVHCCCQIFPIVCGTYLIALHCFLQGAYGVCIIITTSYKPPHYTINYIAMSSYLCLFPAGLCIFCANIYDSWKGAMCCCFFIIFVTIFNFSASLVYYSHYCGFQANSQLDKALFWTGPNDWISSKELPFTLWHILASLLYLLVPVWWYYAYIMCKLAKIFRTKWETEQQNKSKSSSNHSTPIAWKDRRFRSMKSEPGRLNSIV